MSQSAQAKTAYAGPEVEDFGALFEESIKEGGKNEGAVITGIVVSIEKDIVIIDVGLKSEGRVPLREFAVGGVMPELRTGDEVEVYLEKIENKNGEAVLSRCAKKRGSSWKKPMPATSASKALFLAASRAASPSISKVRSLSYRAARSISARSATSRR